MSTSRFRKSPEQLGFTIVELLIVIVVIGILAAITVVAYGGIQARAGYAKSQADMSMINKAIQLYYVDNGTYPYSTAPCNTLNWCGWDQATGDNFIPGLSPKYIANLPQMPTSNGYDDSYIYRSVDGTSYQLMRYRSLGLSATELGSALASSPSWTTTGWGYKSDNLTWN